MGSSVDFCRVSEMGVPTTSELYREFVKDLLLAVMRLSHSWYGSMTGIFSALDVLVFFVGGHDSLIFLRVIIFTVQCRSLY